MSQDVSVKPSQKNEIDMLHGPLLKKILLFALPLAASSLLQELFNSVDVAVVGHYVGSKALAAVGSNTPVIGLLINLFVGVSMGACAVLSHHIGTRNTERIRHTIGTIALVALISGILLLFIGWSAARPILEWMGTPSDVLSDAVLYLRVYFLGMPFIMIFNFGAAILRSVGDTRRPLYILVAAGVLNMILNILFVVCLHLGVLGVAIATGFANLLSAALIVRVLRREAEPYRLHYRSLSINGRELMHMLRIGLPAGLQGVIFSLSNVIVQSSINSFGSDAIAGSAAALNFELYCYFLIQGFNGAAISFIAQNYGAKKIDRVRRVFWICMGMSVLACAVFNVLFATWSEFFLSFFSSTEGVYHYGGIRMHIVLALQFLACSYEIAGSSLRGMGWSLTPALLTVFGTCMLRIFWVYVICPSWHSFDVLMMVYPISWILTGTLVLCAYWMIIRKVRRTQLQS